MHLVYVLNLILNKSQTNFMRGKKNKEKPMRLEKPNKNFEVLDLDCECETVFISGKAHVFK